MNKIKKIGVIVITIMITCNLLTGCDINNDLSQDDKDYIISYIEEKHLQEHLDSAFVSNGITFDYSEIKEIDEDSILFSNAGSDDINDYVNDKLNEGTNRKAFSVMIPTVYTVYGYSCNGYEFNQLDNNCKAYYAVVYDFDTNEFISTSFIPDKFYAEMIND